jgi:threonyl-tRNA synthetase
MNNKLEKIRHSLSHLIAHAVLELYPDVKFGIGPVIDNGFYYDFDLPQPLKLENLPKIEKRITKLIKQNIKFEKIKLTDQEVKKLLKNESYKLELIDELLKNKKPVTFYRSGKFTDLCAGPHVDSTKEINPEAFKLTKVAGAYWRGDEKNKMLQRIYGVAFNTKKELDDYLKLQEELKKRDHRKLGKELDLFSFHDIAPGAAFWHSKGMIIIKELEKFWRKIHDQNGYQETSTPILNKKELWEKSGHWQHYADDMFRFKIDKQEYALKPMNCPGSTYIYSSKLRSYNDLPMTMDDAHIYCRSDQIEKEVTGVIKLVNQFYKIFKFKPDFVLSTMPVDHLGDKKTWDYAESALEQALKKNKITYKTCHGEGAFYGPKIDIIIKDSLSRNWQMATIQLDFNIPKRFNLSYTDQHGKKQTPIIIHRAIFGTFERFIGILTEHYAGNFPVWLSPVQVKVVTVGKAHQKFAKNLHKQFTDAGIRSELDDANETVGYKIRMAEKQKVLYMLVIGDKEVRGKSLNVRIRGKKEVVKMTTKKFTERVLKEIKEKNNS